MLQGKGDAEFTQVNGMLKRRDLIIIVLLLAVALGFYLISQYMGSRQVSQVVARINGEVVFRESLLKNGAYDIPQADGNENRIRVENGVVWMESANCPDALCIHQGKMRSMAKSIVCLPHNLVITLEADSGEQLPPEDGIDVILY